MICTTYFLTFFSELIPPTGYFYIGMKPTCKHFIWLICFRVDSNYNVYFKVIIQCQLKEFG